MEFINYSKVALGTVMMLFTSLSLANDNIIYGAHFSEAQPSSHKAESTAIKPAPQTIPAPPAVPPSEHYWGNPPNPEVIKLPDTKGKSNASPAQSLSEVPAIIYDPDMSNPVKTAAIEPPAPAPAEEIEDSPAGSPPTQHESAGHYLFRQAVSDAIRFHPMIRRALEEAKQNKEAIDEARANYFPSLTAGVKSGIEENEYTGKNEKSSRATLTLNQMLYDFGKTGSKVELAKNTAEKFSLDTRQTMNDIGYQAANSFIQIVKMKQLINIADGQIAGFENISELARKRTVSGASAESDYSLAKVRVATAKAQRHDYQSQLHKWEATLENLTNSVSVTTIAPTLPPLEASACSNVNLSNITAPDILSAEKQITMAKDQIAYYKAEYFPTVSVAPTYEYSLQQDNTLNDYHTKKGTFGVFVNVSAPLYEGGAKASRVRQAMSAYSAALENLQNAKLTAKTRIQESRDQLDTIALSIQALKQREQEAVRTRDLYKLQYLNTGTRSFTDLISAESEIHQTRMTLIDDNTATKSAYLECLYRSGNMLTLFDGQLNDDK